MTSFYHLKIPKTGTIYIKSNLFDPLKDYLVENEIEVLNFGDHEGWGPVKQDTYILSSFRDPVKRTISHFCHYMSSQDTLEAYANQNKENFIIWFEENKQYISDFQSKNLLYVKSENLRGLGWMQIQDEDFINMTIDSTLLKEKVSSIDILINSSSLNLKLINDVSDKILFDLNLPNKKIISEKEKILKYASFSHKIYDALSTEEKDLIYQNNPNDSEIYFTSSYFGG